MSQHGATPLLLELSTYMKSWGHEELGPHLWSCNPAHSATKVWPHVHGPSEDLPPSEPQSQSSAKVWPQPYPKVWPQPYPQYPNRIPGDHSRTPLGPQPSLPLRVTLSPHLTVRRRMAPWSWLRRPRVGSFNEAMRLGPHLLRTNPTPSATKVWPHAWKAPARWDQRRRDCRKRDCVK